MLNLAVADIHAYYVIAGFTPVLVHNTECELGPPQVCRITRTDRYRPVKDGNGGDLASQEYQIGARGTTPTAKETLHPDLAHDEPIGPHVKATGHVAKLRRELGID